MWSVRGIASFVWVKLSDQVDTVSHAWDGCLLHQNPFVICKGIGCFLSVSIHTLLRYFTLAIQPHLTLCRRAGWPRWIWHAELNHSPMSSRNGCWDWKEFVMDENDMGYFRLMLCIIVFGLEKMIKWNNKTVKLDVCCVLEVFFFSCNCTGSVNQRSGAWKR